MSILSDSAVMSAAVPMDSQHRRARNWTWLSVVTFVLFSILVLLLALWGITHDLTQIRLTLLHAEVGRIRSHAIQTVANIQDELHKNSSQDLTVLQQADYPRRIWTRVFQTDASRAFTAVVDMNNVIKLHYKPAFEGKKIPADWYQQDFPDDPALADVVLTKLPELTGGELAYDIQIPIIFQSQTIGTYHSALRSAWIDNLYNVRKSAALSFWIWLLLGILIVKIAASAALYYTSRRVAILQEASKVARSRRYAEIGQLMAGIVHEIRNPLNVMRLNLHVLERYEQLPHQQLTDEMSMDREKVLYETQNQIDCVEGLLRILQSYARPDTARPELLDMRTEIQATLNFVKQLLERREMLVVARMPEFSLPILMDRNCFRQVILNLLNNACEAMSPGGTIEITLRQEQSSAELIVSDQGVGIPAGNYERIFDPFYSTKNTGTGLGLAIVRRHVEDAGGTVRCDARNSGGTQFTVRIPLQQSNPVPAPVPRPTAAK